MKLISIIIFGILGQVLNGFIYLFWIAFFWRCFLLQDRDFEPFLTLLVYSNVGSEIALAETQSELRECDYFSSTKSFKKRSQNDHFRKRVLIATHLCIVVNFAFIWYYLLESSGCCLKMQSVSCRYMCILCKLPRYCVKSQANCTGFESRSEHQF